MIKFEWDENKSASNLIKHHVSFVEAVETFYDDYAILIFDPDHSIDEDRFLLLGISNSSRLLLVSHCYRDNNVIRIISARKATKKETKQYYEKR